MSVDFDVIVVGAGVIGLAIARQLSLIGQKVLVLEKAGRAGTETSSRNSEVIHSGIYYPTGSLKARLCVEGRGLLYAFCKSHGIATKRLGKLVVATIAREEAKLQSIAALAMANGVDDLEWLSQSDVAQLEPEIRCIRALYSPSTGIVDASGFMLALQGDAEANGAVFGFNACFESASKQGDFFVVTAKDVNGDSSELASHTLINCAGHGAHDVAMRIAGYPIEKCPLRYLAKGSYCSVSGKSPFRHLVYPVPLSGALGIHATLDLASALRLGPDIQWTDTIDYSMPANMAEQFNASVQAYWPAVADRILTPSYCGIRPKIHGPQSGFADFEIQFHEQHGISGLINLFGIESPGLTASLAIARCVERGLRG